MSARHDDYKIDWRSHRPVMAVRRKPAKRRGRISAASLRIYLAALRVFAAVRAIPGGEPSNWRDVAVFLVGSAWGVMVTVGLLEAARHLQ